MFCCVLGGGGIGGAAELGGMENGYRGQGGGRGRTLP